MKTTCFVIPWLIISFFVSGCATPARVSQMTVDGQPSQRIASTKLRNNLSIKDVTGGQETNPLWKSNIGNAEFEQALEGSLRAVGFLAPRQQGTHMLTAHLQSVDQPFLGLDMTVTASVRYMVTERLTGKEVFSRVIAIPYTATFGDSLLGVERLRLANEGAIRSNIARLIDELFQLNIQSIAMQ